MPGPPQRSPDPTVSLDQLRVCSTKSSGAAGEVSFKLTLNRGMAEQLPYVCLHLPSCRGPRGSPRTRKMVHEGTWSEGRASGGRTPSVPGGRQGRVPPGTPICGAATETQGPLGPSPSVPCPGSSGGPPALRAPAAPHSPPWPGTAQLPGSCRPAASPGVAQFVLFLTQGLTALSLTLSQLWRRSPRPPERGPGTRVRRASPWLQGEGDGRLWLTAGLGATPFRPCLRAFSGYGPVPLKPQEQSSTHRAGSWWIDTGFLAQRHARCHHLLASSLPSPTPTSSLGFLGSPPRKRPSPKSLRQVSPWRNLSLDQGDALRKLRGPGWASQHVE